MNSEDGFRSNIKHLLQTGATLTILMHLLLFFMTYNMATEIIMLGTGWILLIPGSAILFLSVPQKFDGEDKVRPIFNYVGNPIQIGWAIISISLTFISQTLLSLVLTFVFISFLVLIVRESKIDSITEVAK